MPRKGPVTKREVMPDPIYNSKLVTRLINRIMVDGKRGKAATILYNAFEMIKESTGNDPLEVFEQAMKNIMPVLEVKARRVGGSNYQVPIEVRPDRRMALGLRWLVNYSRLRGEDTMEERLAKEIMDAANNSGASVKNVKIHIKWQKLTKLSLTTVGKIFLQEFFLARNLLYGCVSHHFSNKMDLQLLLKERGVEIRWHKENFL